MTSEDPAGQGGHLILVGQEPLSGVDDAFLVIADLERDDGPYVQRDALLSHALLGNLGLAHGERQKVRLPHERENEGTVAGHYPERCTVHTELSARNQHGLIRPWYSITEHLLSSPPGVIGGYRGSSGSVQALTSTVREPRSSITRT